jgi:glycosyltransferase involved in cell wall biosynthesis
MNILITNHSYDTVISGGDVIAAEYARSWQNSGHSVIIATHQSGAQFFMSRGIQNSMLAITPGASSEKYGLLLAGIVKTISAFFQSLFLKTANPDMIFSSSWMWTDFIPALIFKLRYPKACFVTGCYLLLAPPKFANYGKSFIDRWALWLVYKTGFFLMIHTADIVWTASKIDASNLAKKYNIKTCAIRGGVDVSMSKKVRNEKKIYDAVFLGRFHPQKNILELIPIWKQVVNQIPDARLIIIGNGFLKEAIQKKIVSFQLEKNIILYNCMDGYEKFRMLAESKLFISSSHTDSGNLALDEALACGVPGVIYDLPLVDYPKGVKKVTRFELTLFAETIIQLLKNTKEREELAIDAIEFGESLDWKISAEKALSSLNKDMKM